MNYPWLIKTVEFWQKTIIQQKMPHAILMSGAKGIGKSALAQHMAHIVLCPHLTENGPCNKCQECSLYTAGNHTDLITIKSEKSIIKIDQIRKLSRDIMLSATRGYKRVVIIESAEQMNRSSSNALLKTLEEPPNDVVIILITNEISSILATIKSRCMKLDIQNPTQKQALMWLGQCIETSEQENLFALMLTNGSPIQSKELLENDAIKSIKQMLLDLESIKNNSLSILEVSKCWISNGWDLNLKYIAYYLLNVVKANQNINDNLGVENITGVISGLKTHQVNADILKFIKHIFKVINYQETTLKKELLLDELLIRWHDDFKN